MHSLTSGMSCLSVTYLILFSPYDYGNNYVAYHQIDVYCIICHEVFKQTIDKYEIALVIVVDSLVVKDKQSSNEHTKPFDKISIGEGLDEYQKGYDKIFNIFCDHNH